MGHDFSSDERYQSDHSVSIRDVADVRQETAVQLANLLFDSALQEEHRQAALMLIEWLSRKH